MLHLSLFGLALVEKNFRISGGMFGGGVNAGDLACGWNNAGMII